MELSKSTARDQTPAPRTVKLDQDKGYSIAGCSGMSPSLAQIYQDQLFYVCNHSVLVEGSEYLPVIDGCITAMDVTAEYVVVGSSAGTICVMPRRRCKVEVKEGVSAGAGDNTSDNTSNSSPSDSPDTPSATVTSSGAILSVRATKDTVVCSTRTELLVSDPRLQQTTVVDNVGILVDLFLGEIAGRLYLVSGSYNGRIAVSEVQLSPDSESTPKVVLLAETPSYKSAIQNISGVVQGTTILVTASFSSGKVGIFAYSADTQTLKKTETVVAHKHSCTSARWTNSSGTEMVTSSEDGTAVVWQRGTFWESARICGAIGGPSIVNALVNSRGQVFLQTHSGGIYQAGLSAGTAQHVSGHTRRIVSVQTRGSLILTASEDRTGRIFRVGSRGELAEIARPVISGHAMSAAVFLDERRIATAADENLVRIYQATNLFQSAVGEAADPKLCFTAQQQELSLTTLPHNPEAAERAVIAAVSQSELGLLSNQFCELQKVYGFPFEIKAMEVVPNKLVCLGCKSSQKEFSALFVLNLAGKIIQKVEAHTLNITKIVVSPDGRYLATAGRDQRVVLFEIVTGLENFAANERLAAFEQNDTGVRVLDVRRDQKRECIAVAFAGDSQTLYTASKDRVLNHYSVKERTLHLSAQEITPEKITALYHHGELYLGTENGEVYTADSQQRVKLHNAAVVHLSEIAEPYQQLLSASADGVVRVTPMV